MEAKQFIGEIWRPIKGYEDWYEVSSFGRIRNNRTGRILKPFIRGGYLSVHLSKNGISTNFVIHRLVAEAFIPNPLNLPCVNHKSEIKTDNRVENLEWCDFKYNTTYGSALIRKAITQGKKVFQYDLKGNLIGEYWSAAEATRQTGVKKVSSCCNGKRRTAGIKGGPKYIWSYTKKG